MLRVIKKLKENYTIPIKATFLGAHAIPKEYKDNKPTGNTIYYSNNDVHKKLKTDALTKGLSELGFNSDIFEGKFDDNKYVQEMNVKFNPLKPTGEKPEKEQDAIISTLALGLSSSKTIEQCNLMLIDIQRKHFSKDNQKEIARLKQVHHDRINAKGGK